MADLSVSIRSVRPNPFVRRELESIRAQGVDIAEVIIAIPQDLSAEDNAAWAALQAETPLPIRLVRAPRGMIPQRIASVQASRSSATLVLDDDLVLPPGFISTMVAALRTTAAQCVLPFIPEALPRRGPLRVLYALCGMAIPYAGVGGNRYMATGGYRYASEPLPHGKIVETEGGIGWVFLVDTAFARAHPQFPELQQTDTLYTLREDASFVQALKLAGGKVVMVNAGHLEHLGGTTRVDPRRLTWQWEAAIRDNFLFWRKYILPTYRSLPGRLAARGGIAWHLAGNVAFAGLVALRQRSSAPLRGVVSGFRKLL
jgi:GT2 family glycosyltransferase